MESFLYNNISDAIHDGPGNKTHKTSMPDALDNLYPALIRCFGVIILGYIAGRLGVISATEAKGISKFAVYPTLPAFIFKALATLDFSQVKWMFVLVVALSKCIIFVGVAILTILFTRNVEQAGIYGVFCTMSNDLALGVPILKALYDKTHGDFIYCVYFLALLNLAVFLTAGLLMMEFGHQRLNDKTAGLVQILLKTVKAVLLSPVICASVLGVVANKVLDRDLPRALDAPLETLSQAFPAAALFYLGSSIVGKVKTQVGMIIVVPLSLTAAKVVILPLIIRGLCTSFNIGGDELNEDWSIFGFIYGTVPPAPPVVIYAGMFGIQEDLLAFGLVVSTMVSAPVMFISAKMATVHNMNSTNIEYRSLLTHTRNDVSFVAIAIACWVIVILFLSRRYKTPPHNYLICLVVSQLCLCISFVLTKSSSFVETLSGLEAFLIVTFLIATHVWTAILAYALSSIRCSPYDQPISLKLKLYLIGCGVPVCIGAIVTIILKSDLENYSWTEHDFFSFLMNKKVCLGFWVAIQFSCIPICLASLVRLYRCDQYCKCKLMKFSKRRDEGTPLLPDRNREGCHRCQHSDLYLASSRVEEHPLSSSESFGSDLDKIIITRPSDTQPTDNRNGKQLSRFQLEHYYQGERHQSGRHVLVIMSQILLMVICIFYSMWILVGDEKKSGIFLEVQLLVSITLSAQVLVIFALFGFERALVIDPFLQKVRHCWYGVDEVILPRIHDLPSDEYHICEQFVHYHKANCLQALSPVEEGSLGNSLDSAINDTSFVFLGNQLVDWLLEVGLVLDRTTAVHYGNSLLRGRVIRHSENRYYFRDSSLTYEFCPEWDLYAKDER